MAFDGQPKSYYAQGATTQVANDSKSLIAAGQPSVPCQPKKTVVAPAPPIKAVKSLIGKPRISDDGKSLMAAGQPQVLPGASKAVSVGAPAVTKIVPLRQPLRFPAETIAASLEIDYGLYEIVESSLYSCLMPEHVTPVSELFLAQLKAWSCPINSIIDGTTNAGCDGGNLCRLFPSARVLAIEQDPETFRCLKGNVQRLKEKYAFCANLTAVCADTVQYIRENKVVADLIYLDPPWGGRNFRSVPKLELALSGVPLVDLTRELLQKHAPVVVLKLPPSNNFNLKAFASLSGVATIVAYGIEKQKRKQQFGGAAPELAFRLVFFKRK